MATYDGAIRINTRIDTKSFNSGIKSMMGSLGSLVATFGVAFGVAGIAAFSRASVKAAAASESAWTGLRFVLDANNRSFDASKQFLNDYVLDGLVPLTNAISAYQNMVTRGYGQTQIEEMLRVMKDAAAFARQGQFSMGEAIEKTTQGLRMENSLLTDSVGIQTNVAKMWAQYAAEIGTTANNLTHAQKLQAEYNGFMREGGVFAGAAAQYLTTYAGRVSQLSAAFTNFKIAVGNAIIPVLNAILPAVISAINWFTRLFNIVGRVMNLLFGTNVGASDMEQVAGSSQAAADAQGELAKNTEKAGKAAKGALASFDKLNVLADPSGSGGGGGGTSPVGGGTVEIPKPETGGVSEAIDELSGKVAQLKADFIAFFEPLREPFARLKAAIIELGGTIWSGLEWAWTEILQPFIAWAAQEVAPRALELLAVVIENLNIVLAANKPLIEDIWENTLKPILSWTGNTITDILDLLIEKLEDFGEWAADNPTKIQQATTVLLGFFMAWKTAQLAGIITGVVTSLVAHTGALVTNTIAWIANTAAKLADKAETIAIAALYAGDFIRNLVTSTGSLIANTGAWISSTAAKIANTVATAAGTAATWLWNAAATVGTAVTTAFGAAVAFLTSPIGLVILAIVALIAIVVLLIKNWDKVKEWAINAWTKIKETWAVVAEWFRVNVSEPIGKWFKQAWTNIKNWAVEAWEDIKRPFAIAYEWFMNTVINPIKNAFDVVWGGISSAATKAFESVVNGIKTVLNALIRILNNVLEGIGRGMNGLINSLNKIKVDIPSWVPLIGGKKFAVSIGNVQTPQIPYLATGAVIPPNAPFAAILGDNKTQSEILAPDDKIRQIFREEMAGMNLGRNDNVTVQFGGTIGQFIQQLNPYIEKEKLRVGTSMALRRAGI